jgi:hypothetical protein
MRIVCHQRRAGKRPRNVAGKSAAVQRTQRYVFSSSRVSNQLLEDGSWKMATATRYG